MIPQGMFAKVLRHEKRRKMFPCQRAEIIPGDASTFTYCSAFWQINAFSLSLEKQKQKKWINDMKESARCFFIFAFVSIESEIAVNKFKFNSTWGKTHKNHHHLIVRKGAFCVYVCGCWKVEKANQMLSFVLRIVIRGFVLLWKGKQNESVAGCEPLNGRKRRKISH